MASVLRKAEHNTLFVFSKLWLTSCPFDAYASRSKVIKKVSYTETLGSGVYTALHHQGRRGGTDTLWLVVVFAGLRVMRQRPLLRLVIKGGVQANCSVPFTVQLSHRGSGLRCYFVVCKITTQGVTTHTPWGQTSRLVGGSPCASRQEGGTQKACQFPH